MHRINPELRKQAAINERVMRLWVGIEDTNDLIEDLEQALQFRLPVRSTTRISEPEAESGHAARSSTIRQVI